MLTVATFVPLSEPLLWDKFGEIREVDSWERYTTGDIEGELRKILARSDPKVILITQQFLTEGILATIRRLKNSILVWLVDKEDIDRIHTSVISRADRLFVNIGNGGVETLRQALRELRG